MNNDEKVKEMLEKEPVPQELEPENIKAMLDEKAPQKKRSGISVGGRLAATAAAFAVIGGGSYAYLSNVKPERKTLLPEPTSSIVETTVAPTVEQTQELFSQQAYMSGAKDYSQIYELMKQSAEKQEKQMMKYSEKGVQTFGAVAEDAEESADLGGVQRSEAETVPAAEEPAEFDTVTNDEAVYSAAAQKNEGGNFAEDNAGDGDLGAGAEEEIPEFSDTHNQEQDVLEADIVKTDGKYIYYISNSSNGKDIPVLRSAEAKDGKFLSSHTTSVEIPSFYENADYNGNFVEDMYLYNDMIVVIGDTFSDWEEDGYYHSKQTTYAAFFTTGDTPELIDVYYQDGYYSDVRIAPDGFMYLVTTYTSEEFSVIEDAENYEDYIPQCGTKGKCGLIPPEDILLPPEDDERLVTYVNYSIIGSVDLNTSGEPSAADTKALADYTGQLYASPDNFYTNTYHGEQSEITRISIGNGTISPEASATLDGYVKDQFSMSEYGGYFRVAVTRERYTENEPSLKDRIFQTDDDIYYGGTFERDNALYIYDMGMNMVGSYEGFGETESIKSVSFQGNIGYVVTYEQTDPLFAFDLSDPTSPKKLDEFKINGYSTYMQQWSDGLLFGFGVNANEDGIETGVKMVMFDNSDPEDLKEVGFWSLDRDINDENSGWIYSMAIWDRKALLIAPEKNFIGFPIELNNYVGDRWTYENEFRFFSYENGEFVEKGSIKIDNSDYRDDYVMKRALYIGDYVYILSGSRFIAADMATIDITDDMDFSDGDRVKAEETEVTTEEATTETTTETSAETSTEATYTETTETTAEETTSVETTTESAAE